VNESLVSHRYHEAGQALWDFVWKDFCDWYLEIKKLRFRENSGLDDNWTEALTVYEAMLRLLHPFMPFVTEELWQRLVENAEFPHAVSISLESYPQAADSAAYVAASERFALLQQVVKAARELRADSKLDPKATLPATLYLHAGEFDPDEFAAIAALSKLTVAQRPGQLQERGGLIRSTPDFDLVIHAAAAAQNGSVSTEMRARIQKDIAAKERAIESSRRQLSDEKFLSNAPEHVVTAMRAKMAEYEAQVAKNKRLLEGEHE
jgi:valyl-tRNA synthetase